MVRRSTTGEWTISEQGLRTAATTLGIVAPLVTGLFAAGVAWAMSEYRAQVLETRVAAVERATVQMQQVRGDLDALLRFRCIDSTSEQQRLAGLRCERLRTSGDQSP
jgi:hypothetical protein